MVELLLRAGVTTVAEAAFQDRLWRTGLESLLSLAQLRIVQCTVDADVAFARSLRRRGENPLRRAHADPRPQNAAEHARDYDAFARLSVDAPSVEVDTTDGYRPALSEIVAFVNEQT